MTPRRKQLRAQVYDRDHAICRDCGTDCDRLRDIYIQAELRDEANSRLACPVCGWTAIEATSCLSCGSKRMRRERTREARAVVEEELLARGYSIPWIVQLRANGARGTQFWQHDHIVGLDEGGEDGLENSQTLCWPHHAAKTAGQAGRRRIANEGARRKERKRHAKGCRVRSLGGGKCNCGKETADGASGCVPRT